MILTDTVGFIRDLPHDLMDSFMATLEELNDADLLIHLVDASNPGRGTPHRGGGTDHLPVGSGAQGEHHSVQQERPDRAPRLAALRRRYNALAISALDKSTLSPLLAEIERRIFETDPR